MPSVQFKDYYKTLGVPKTAAESDIKAAYRKLAKQYHPDRNPGSLSAEDRFKEINEANEVLTDPAKRKLYDRYGEDWQHYQAAGFTGSEPRSRGSSGSSAGADDFGTWFARQNGSSTRFDDGVFQTEFRTGSGGFSDFSRRSLGAAAPRPASRLHAASKGQLSKSTLPSRSTRRIAGRPARLTCSRTRSAQPAGVGAMSGRTPAQPATPPAAFRRFARSR